jgi:hypothetical protein
MNNRKNFLILLLTIVTTCHFSYASALTIEELIDKKPASEPAPADDKRSPSTENRPDTSETHKNETEPTLADRSDKERYSIELDYGSEFKDPRLACLLSVMMPGAGHLYLRDDIKGMGFCLLTMSGYSATGYFGYDAFYGAGASGDFVSRFTIPGVFLFVSTAVHAVSIIEAHADAEEHNKKIIIYGKDAQGKTYKAKIIIEK